LVGDEAILMDLARRLDEAREERRRQRPQLHLLGLREKGADLLADRAMQARVGDGALPVGEKQVLGGKAVNPDISRWEVKTGRDFC
jgi:hypothetical protein